MICEMRFTGLACRLATHRAKYTLIIMLRKLQLVTHYHCLLKRRLVCIYVMNRMVMLGMYHGSLANLAIEKPLFVPFLIIVCISEFIDFNKSCASLRLQSSKCSIAMLFCRSTMRMNLIKMEFRIQCKFL